MVDSALFTLSGYRPPETGGIPRPVRRSPLDAYASAFAELGPQLRVVERPFRTMLDLRFATDAPEWSFDGITMPGPLSTTGAADQGALWLGPGWFLLVLPKQGNGDSGFAPEDRVGDQLADRVARQGTGADHPTSVVDVSAWRTIVDLAGPRALSVLRTGCSLDLREQSFGPGACASTLLARSPAQLQRLPDDQTEPSMRPCYRVFVRASYAYHFATWLLDAADGAGENP